jgi:hypothetical protein
VLHGMPFGTFTVCALPTVMISLIVCLLIISFLLII